MGQKVASLDVHKRTITYVVMDGPDIIEGPKQILTNRPSLEAFAIDHVGVTVIMEAMTVHEYVYDALRGCGMGDVRVYQPFKRDKRRGKTDPQDAIRGGRRFFSGELTFVWVPPPELRNLRHLVRHRGFLVADQTQWKNHIHGYINQRDPAREKLPRDLEGSTVFSKKNRTAVLGAFPELEGTFQVYDALHDAVARGDKEFEKTAESFEPVRRMMTIPGVGPTVGLALFVEIGDISRFPNVETVVSYFGLDPVKEQSGDGEVDLHTISKEGRSYIRGLLVQAAWTHVRVCPESDLGKKYRDLRERKEPQVAIVATARRLLRVAAILWKDNRDFAITGPAERALAGSQVSA